MIVKVCINHPDRPAQLSCFQCHKPLCDDCVRVVKDGQFCSEKCRSQYLAFRAKAPVRKSGGGLIDTVRNLVIYAVLIVALLYVAARWGGFSWAEPALALVGIRV